MSSGDAENRVGMPGYSSGNSGRNPRGPVAGASSLTARKEYTRQENQNLIETVVERENMFKALRQVETNKGSAGVDGVTVDALRAELREHWPRIKEELLEGRYQPQPVRKVEIPKPGGKGMRQLGIPTVMDRLIQQALNQILQSIFDPCFSDSSYGFRPNRSAHQAVLKAREYAASGRRWVVDMDLEKFFDRVNHDILMARIARKIIDKRVLRLIRRYLQAGLMIGGIVLPRVEGTPQGGPLSPLLSNILLDDLDKELEKRGHTFCRYADDCNVYVKSKLAGQRVLDSITHFLAKTLKLKVNSEKSAVARPWDRKFLGYSMTFHKQSRLKVASAVVDRFKGKLREMFRAARGRNIGYVINEMTPVLRGWVNYFRLAEVRGIFEQLDEWIRRKLRCIIWRQWKRTYTRAKKLMKCGLGEERAWRSAKNQRGPWWNSGASHMNQCFPKRFFDQLGLVSLLSQLRRLQYTT